MYEYGAYLSNLITVPVGTVIGSGRRQARMAGSGVPSGDIQICSYEGLGTLTNPVIAEPAPRTTTSSR